jgi:putative DNA primase/helicase
MKDIAANDYSRLSKNLPEEVIQELKASAIAPDIIALNFYSFDGNDENELDEVFTELIHDPKHNNNGTLSGTAQNNLANHLRSGGWYFKGYKGFCAKPNNPRKDKDGKVIKYESPQGAGNLQIFIPRVTWRITLEMEVCVRAKRTLPEDLSLDDEDTNFWEWFSSTDGYR